jgi:hypothetical protein
MIWWSALCGGRGPLESCVCLDVGSIVDQLMKLGVKAMQRVGCGPGRGRLPGPCG